MIDQHVDDEVLHIVASDLQDMLKIGRIVKAATESKRVSTSFKAFADLECCGTTEAET